MTIKAVGAMGKPLRAHFDDRREQVHIQLG
jgi:hypothetical protein